MVAIRGVEAQAASDEAVEMGRDGGAIAVGAERGLQVIDEEEEDVRALRGLRRRGGVRARGGDGEGGAGEEGERAHE